MFVKKNESEILTWVQTNQLGKLGQYLMSGTIHGKPGVPVAELGRVEKIIKKNFSDEDQYHLGKKLLSRTEYTARNIGTHLITAGWPKYQKIESLMKTAANDEDWIVREYAAGAFASLLEKDFEYFSNLYLKWTETESINVKRAIALAIKYESKSADPKKWKTYFQIISPLMHEEAEYIRKNLGPFTIGDGLLSRYPKQVLSACQKWAKSKNENVRWNTAMIFTAAAARKYSKESKGFLQILASDERPFVARAAQKAVRC